MKKWIIFLLPLLLVMGGCTKQSSKQDYDFVLSDRQNLVAFKWNGNAIEKVGKIANVLPEQVSFYFYNTFEFSNRVLGSSASYGGKNFFLYDLDKETLAVRTRKTSSGEPKGEALTASEEGIIYGIVVTMEDVQLIKYKEDLQVEKSVSFSNSTAMGKQCIYDTIAVGDKVYATIGIQDDASARIKFELWILNTELDLEQKISLDVNEDRRKVGYDLAYGDGILYIAQWLEVDLYGDIKSGGKSIQTLNLSTMELGEISLENPYPKYLTYDKEKHILQVSHDSTEVADNLVTFVEMKTGEQKTIKLDGGSSYYYFTKRGEDYFYVFPQKMIKYTYDTEERIEYNLEEYDIKSSDIMFFSD
ncbi:hypothetical protein ACTGVR_01135 [Streptococcus suis]|uniref:Lipoprotein n=1 Tax=Streptococcus suis TaxID=1307 RepID=A0A9X4MYV9_STRSU|nr:hypothetical protein [Streptococcus suis]MDG4525983.1 hypothetical protein [Streptococcus suis]MDG4528369.1 hypothetical protein [Streptococcus suis]HEM2741098.1 hypothetical protein [Streptococcus suis]HEM2864974.1 hypothetical protein [Streptococcus suis]